MFDIVIYINRKVNICNCKQIIIKKEWLLKIHTIAHQLLVLGIFETI